MVYDWYKKLLCGVPFTEPPLPPDESARARLREAAWLIQCGDPLCLEIAHELGIEYEAAQASGWFIYAVLAELPQQRR